MRALSRSDAKVTVVVVVVDVSHFQMTNDRPTDVCLYMLAHSQVLSLNKTFESLKKSLATTSVVVVSGGILISNQPLRARDILLRVMHAE